MDTQKKQAILDYMSWIAEQPEFKAEVERQREELLMYGQTTSRMPFKCPTESAGAFKSIGGTEVASKTNRSPEAS